MKFTVTMKRNHEFQRLYHKGKSAASPYLALYCLAALPGALAQRALVWELADLANALMALPNLVSLLLLSGEAARITRRYFAQRQSE